MDRSLMFRLAWVVGGRYAANAERLVRRGFRVVVVEQTETPEMLAERKRKDKSVKDKVVRREAVAVSPRAPTESSAHYPTVTEHRAASLTLLRETCSRLKKRRGEEHRQHACDHTPNSRSGLDRSVCACHCGATHAVR